MIVDFPQVVDIHNNRNARAILERDINRVCDYFIGLGLRIRPSKIINRFWRAYGIPDANQEELLINLNEAVSFDDYELEDD